jgi:23S rRNA pseudouridine1911/1915/1917 synthase
LKIIAQKPMRLDVCLQEKLETSRNQVEQLIKKHGVIVDGKKVYKSGLKLKGGESIEVILPTPESETPKKIDFDIEIIYEDDDLLIINKPPHLVVHPAPSVKEPTLVDWLKHKGISLSTLSGEERHGIVHRIDKETSGALVVAKNNEAHLALSRQLEDKSMGRYYLAIIDQPLKENIIIEKAISRHPTKRTKMTTSDSGREAKSAFLKLTVSKNNTHELIAAKLFTGRTHQIRVHLKSLSRHILNDYTYGYKSKKDTNSRVMLHAYLIYFIHPKSGKLIIKEAPLFEDFIGILSEKFNMETIDEKTNSNTIIDSFTHYF